MIDERMEEQASLYALGCLSAEETRAFETALRGDAELQRLVAALQSAAEAVAGNVPAIAPPPGLKEQILAKIERSEKIVPLPTSSSGASSIGFWLPWALAACLAVICMVQASHQGGLREIIDQKIAQADQATHDRDEALAKFAKMQQLAQTLEQTTNDLQQTILALQETNRITNLRVAMLSSLLEDQPKAVAVSLWDEKNQKGVFLVQNLKPLPKDKDYQLWVIDPQYGTPVDAGIFQVDADGKVRFEFKAKQLIKTANKFAVTQEEKGGSPTPKGQMVLIGG